jgi:hypothetical protein
MTVMKTSVPVAYFRLDGPMSYRAMGSGTPQKMYIFQAKEPVMVTVPSDIEMFRGKSEVIECDAKGMPVLDDNSPTGAAQFAGRSLSYHRFAAGPMFQDNEKKAHKKQPVQLPDDALEVMPVGKTAVPPPAKKPRTGQVLDEIPEPQTFKSDVPVEKNVPLRDETDPVRQDRAIENAFIGKPGERKKRPKSKKQKEPKKPVKKTGGKTWECRSCGKAYGSRQGRAYHEKNCTSHDDL